MKEEKKTMGYRFNDIEECNSIKLFNTLKRFQRRGLMWIRTCNSLLVYSPSLCVL